MLKTSIWIRQGRSQGLALFWESFVEYESTVGELIPSTQHAKTTFLPCSNEAQHFGFHAPGCGYDFATSTLFCIVSQVSDRMAKVCAPRCSEGLFVLACSAGWAAISHSPSQGEAKFQDTLHSSFNPWGWHPCGWHWQGLGSSYEHLVLEFNSVHLLSYPFA